MNTSNDENIVINNVRLLDNDEPHTIAIHKGIIDSIGKSADNTAAHSSPSAVVVDAQNQLAVSGMCDLYARLREPGLTRKGTIATESQSALRAGFTRVLCAPDTLPSIDSIATVQLIRQRAEAAQGADILPIAALTTDLEGEQLSELATLQAAGCPVASQADMPLSNANVLYSAMEYAASFSIPLLMCARDTQLGADGCAHAGAMATRLGLPGIPVAAETVALARLLEVCRETECRLHISRVSSARALQMIDAAKQAALPVTCDVGLHHLYFTDELIAGYDASFHSKVPFRTVNDRDALREVLRNGTIDAICTDHAPHERDAGLAPFPATEPGLAAYHWAMPLILQLPELLGMSLPSVFDKLNNAPKRIIDASLPKGLSEGETADFFLLDETPLVAPAEITLESIGANNPLNIHGSAELELSPMYGKVTAAFLQNRYHQF